MALTKHQEPQIYTPAFNEQVIIYESNQTAVSDFKYIVYIVIDSTSYRFDIYARPDGLLVYDLKDVVSNYVKTKIDFSNPNQTATTEWVIVTVNIVEFYSDVEHAPDTIIYNVFNACLKDKDFSAYVSTDYYKPIIGNYTDANIFMNESFSDVNIDQNFTLKTDYWLTFIKGLATNYTWILYDETMTALNSGTVPLAGLGTEDVVRVNLSPTNIGTLAGVAVENGYTIEASVNKSLDVLAEVFVPTISEVCTYHKVYRLYFLKRNGAIAYKTFEKISELKVDKKINTVEFNPSIVTESGGIFSYGKTSDMHSTAIVSTESTYVYTLNSDWVTEAQKIKLEELFDSPKVWLQDDTDGSYTAVTIKDSSYTFDKHVNEPLFNYTVNVVVNQKETRQRGL